MCFGLADPQVIEAHCKRFRSILANYVVERILAEGKKRRMIPGERFSDLVLEVCNMLGEHFRRYFHPEPTLAYQNLGSGGTMAMFDPELWQVSVHISLVTTQGDFPIKFAPVVFSSIYHEYRHAEQFALMIRYAWAQHPAWLRYQDMSYNAERNALVPQAVRVSPTALRAAYDAWHNAVRTMGNAETEAMIRRSLSTVGGARVSLKAVRSLAGLPLCVLAGFDQVDIDQAALWYQSRFRTWAEEYGGRSNLLESGRMIDADETAAANIASAEAGVYGDVVDVQLKEWNKAKPTGFPNWSISPMSAEGKALDTLRTTRKPFDAAAAKACYDYLTLLRQQAVDLIKATQGWYEGVPLEADTHALERKIGLLLEFSSKVVDSVGTSSGVMKDKYLPKPTDWSLQF